MRALSVSTDCAGGVELGQDEEDVVLSWLKSVVLIAVVDHLAAQCEACRHGAGFEAGSDVWPLHVYLVQLSCCPCVSLLYIRIPQQLRRDRDRDRHSLRTSEVSIQSTFIQQKCF